MKKNVKKIVSSFLVAMMVCAASFSSFAAETAQKTESVAAVSNLDYGISVYSESVSIPYYFYLVEYNDGGVYRSPVVYHTVTVPKGKKVYVGDPKVVSTTNSYNGVAVKCAGRFEYPYSFK